MLPIKPSKQSLICLGIAVVGLLVVLSFTYYQLARRVHSLDVQIAKKGQQLESSKEIARRLTTVEQEYLDAQTTLGILEQGVSTKSYVPTLLRQVEELGRNVNLRVVGVRPKPDNNKKPPPAATPDGKQVAEQKKPEPYDKLLIDVEMNGKYADVSRFLYGITSFPKIIAVNTVELKPIKGPDQITSPDLSITINTTAFILKDTARKPVDDMQQTAQAVAERT